MNKKEIYDRLVHALDQTVNGWRKTDKLTPIEQEERLTPVVWGIVEAALHLLPFEDYCAFKEEVRRRGINT